jgi:hypothetical protein
MSDQGGFSTFADTRANGEVAPAADVQVNAVTRFPDVGVRARTPIAAVILGPQPASREERGSFSSTTLA